MIWIPGIVITILTFPGFVMKTVARRFWCDLLGVPVYEAHYFKGTITHEKIDSPVRAALVVFAPLSLNTVLCAILLFPIVFSVFLGSTGQEGTIYSFFMSVLMWAGISIGMHALPTRTTINYYLESLPEHMRRGFVYSILFVTGQFFILIDFLKRFWLDLVYAVVVGMATPLLITRIFMAL
jgi:hypothetical protein